MTHPAITRSIELYDARNEEGELRDMEPHEQAFRDAVTKIRDRKTDAYKAANRMFGDTPKQYRACLLVIDQESDKDLTAALEVYERDVEAADELLEINAAVAHAMAEHAPLQAAE